MSVPLDDALYEFAKLAEIDLEDFQRLSKKNLFNKFESLLTPRIKEEDPELAQKAQASTQAERDYFRKRYNVTARLTGSMPLELGVPGDVDLDFYSRIKSPQKFNQVVKRLEGNPDYVGSKYNKPGAAFQVYQRQARGKDDFPVDFAIAYGSEADRLAGQLKKKEQAAAALPKDVKGALVEKKMMLKHTPFDIKGKRYKAWKRDLDKALGGGEVIRLKREAHPDLVADLQKAAAVLNLKKEDDLNKFQKFVQRDDVYGHRTPHAESVLGSGKIMSAMEALQKGKVKSVETGWGVGARKDISTDNKLSNTQIKGLEEALLAPQSSKVDYDKASDISMEADLDYNEMMAEFLRRKKSAVKKHLGTVDNPEQFRRDHLSLPKLGPNIFVTKGGIMDEPKYGDVSLLVRSRTATQSPFANTLTDEHIIEPKKPGDPRSLNVRSGFVIAPTKKIQQLSRKYPGFKYVKEEQIPDEIKKTLYKPTRSAKEVVTRLVPKFLSGELRLQNR